MGRVVGGGFGIQRQEVESNSSVRNKGGCLNGARAIPVPHSSLAELENWAKLNAEA
jgi:hypothetical protein